MIYKCCVLKIILFKFKKKTCENTLGKKNSKIPNFRPLFFTFIAKCTKYTQKSMSNQSNLTLKITYVSLSNQA